MILTKLQYVSGNKIHRREKSQMTSERDISDLSAKDEGNDAHRTDPPYLQERCLVTVVHIAAYVILYDTQ